MQIRLATKDELGFIYETFLRSFRATSTHAEGVASDKIVGMLSGLRDKGWLPCVAESEGYLQGWAVYEVANHLAWVYVRDMFRGNAFSPHVAKELLKFAHVDTSKRIVTPFLPNRTKGNWKFVHRPFLVI